MYRLTNTPGFVGYYAESFEEPFGKHEPISTGQQVLGNDSESEGTRDALMEVLADHSTAGKSCKRRAEKVGNDYPKDPL